MQRTKVFAVATGLVAAVTATVLLAGGASAATWHVYEGDVYSGHAYALDVPDGAQSVEFLFAGAEAGTAAIGVYAPDGEKAGFYELGADLTAASVANPDTGRYVVYVYDVTDGALSIRVNSKAEPAELQLTEIALARQDIRIGEFVQGKLDQQITADLKTPTVFVTLLYEGSAKDLDATVSSEKGAVVTIVDETATAFSPGVWTSLKGERTFDAANLDGAKYTVEVHAAQFEGRMILTTLALDLQEAAMPVTKPVPAPPAPAKAPRAHSQLDAEGEAAATPEFALQQLTAVAFAAPAGTLVLVDPALLERMAAEEKGEGYEYGDDCEYVHGLVSIYAPDDTLLASVTLDHENPTAEVELPVSGEYVAYTHGAQRDVVLAKIIGASVAPTLRVLELEEVETVVPMDGLALDLRSAQIQLERIPLTIDMRLEGIGALTSAHLTNELGEVAGTQELVSMHGPISGWAYVNRENFAAGVHDLSMGGAFEGDVVIQTLHFIRDSEVVVEEVAKPQAEQEQEPEEPEAPSTPFPPVPPVGAIPDLLDLPW